MASYTSLSGQYQGIYISEIDSNTFVNINKNDIEIYQVLNIYEVEDILERNLILKSSYRIVADTIYFSQYNKQLAFQLICEDKLQSLGDIKPLIRCNTKFYCIRKKDENGKIIYIGRWKEGEKDGDWLYFTKDGNRIKITYDKGVVVQKTCLDD